MLKLSSSKRRRNAVKRRIAGRSRTEAEEEEEEEAEEEAEEEEQRNNNEEEKEHGMDSLVAGKGFSEVCSVAAAAAPAGPLLPAQLILTLLQLLCNGVPHLLHIPTTNCQKMPSPETIQCIRCSMLACFCLSWLSTMKQGF